MKLNIPREFSNNEDLPIGFKVTKRLYRSPMVKEYIAIAEFNKGEEVRTAIISFDGISETPISIDTFMEFPTPITNKDNLK